MNKKEKENQKSNKFSLKKYIVTIESTHLSNGDYDNLPYLSNDDINCGTVEEHLKNNTCPKINGKIGNIHFELYVQWDIIVEANSKEEANNLTNNFDWSKTDIELDNYLKSCDITEFNHDDFDSDTIRFDELDIYKNDKFNYLDRYQKDSKMKLSTQLKQKKPFPIISEMIIVHEKLYYNNGDF